MRTLKTIEEMNPQEEQEYIDQINDYFCDFLKAAPFIELGEVEDMRMVKLRAHVHEGQYSVGEIIFELQMNLYRYQMHYPEKKIERMIVSRLELTQDVSDPLCFCPLRGVMIKIKYV